MTDPKKAFGLGYIIVVIKFLLGGMILHTFKIPDMSGSDFALAIAAVGSIHSLSVHVDNLGKKSTDPKKESEE